MSTLLSVRNLVTRFHTAEGIVYAAEQVSFDIPDGAVLGLVGESGSGKSVTALSLLRLIPSPPGRIESGEAIFKGEDILKKPVSELRSIRGKNISMIFQEPMNSLNPVITIGKQVAEVIEQHTDFPPEKREAMTCEILKKVGIPSAESRMKSYPHEMSGGMMQRAMIAMALVMKPDLLIADEPTTALDVTIQAQIMDLLRELRSEMGMSVLLITHNLGLVAQNTDRVAVMYAGRIVEMAETEDLIRDPKHPYTQCLLKAVPDISKDEKRLYSISGNVPSLKALPQGCPFEPRCPQRMQICKVKKPEMVRTGPMKSSDEPFSYDTVSGRIAACFLYGGKE